MWVAFLFPLVAHDDRELEWLSKGFVLPTPYQYFCVPRLLRPTLRYELLMRDDDRRRLFYWFKNFEAVLSPLDPGGDLMRAVSIGASDVSLSATGIGEPQPLDGIQLPSFPYAPNASPDSRILP